MYIPTYKFMHYGYICKLSVCCMIYTLGYMAHYLCTVRTTGSLTGKRFDKSGGTKILTKNWHMNKLEKGYKL